MMRLLSVLACAALLPAAEASTSASPKAAIASLLHLSEEPSALPYIWVQRTDSAAVHGIVADVVPLPLEHVLHEVVLCYEVYPQWYPYQSHAEYKDRKEIGGTVYGVVQLPWPLGQRDYELRVEGHLDPSASARTYVIDFEHRAGSGNIETLSGRWLLQEYGPEQTLVVQDAAVDFNTFIPGFLMKVGTQRYLPSVTRAIKQRTGKCEG